ncbi:hypothetical protein K501DRAFT_331636 [Backusella circina FSU 941]|nr:hypothetical protein K501DRAFT_331636 [Backusella circina FSU 941]
MNDDISKRTIATPTRRLNRTSSNLSAGEPKPPNPLSNLSFNLSSGTNSQQQQGFSITSQPPSSQAPLFGANPIASFGAVQPKGSSVVGFASNAPASSSPFRNIPTSTVPTSSAGANTATYFGSKPPSVTAPIFGGNTTPPSSSFGAVFSASPAALEKPIVPSFNTTTSTSSSSTAAATSASPFSFGNNSVTSKSTFSFNVPGVSSITENKPSFTTEKAGLESDKKENMPLFGNDDKNKKDEKVPAFSFNASKKDEGIFSKPPATNVFTPLNLNNKRENNDTAEPSAKKVLFSISSTEKNESPALEPEKKEQEETKKDTEKVPFTFGTTKKDEPSVSLAFSTKKESKSDSTTLCVSATSEYTLPTVIKSNITTPNQITKKTLFYELPQVAQDQLAEFNHFVTTQSEKLNKAALDTEFTIGSRVRAMKTESTNLNSEADILLKQLDNLNNKLTDMILKNNTHRVNITAVQLMQQHQVKNWRLRGAAENWSFFKEMVDNTQNRLDHYKTSINSIEETIVSLQRSDAFASGKFGAVIESQGHILISLAGRIAELHEQVERITNKKA